jgi:hypothetical protein
VCTKFSSDVFSKLLFEDTNDEILLSNLIFRVYPLSSFSPKVRSVLERFFLFLESKFHNYLLLKVLAFEMNCLELLLERVSLEPDETLSLSLEDLSLYESPSLSVSETDSLLEDSS